MKWPGFAQWLLRILLSFGLISPLARDQPIARGDARLAYFLETICYLHSRIKGGNRLLCTVISMAYHRESTMMNMVQGVS